jgi:hypothetical protein
MINDETSERQKMNHEKSIKKKNRSASAGPGLWPAVVRRSYQEEALEAFRSGVLRLFCLLWERQSGKSTTLADMSLGEMVRRRDHTCVYASASLLLSREIVLKQSQRAGACGRELVEQEAAMLQKATQDWAATAASGGMLFQTADAARDKVLGKLSLADYASLFEEQRLEFRVYHDDTSYSRTKVIAPNVATARSWSGTVFLDEIAFIPDLKELMVAVLPITSTDPEFKLILSTTPPEFDDTHYSYELLAPPAGIEFAPHPRGNWYESESGISVHRADAFDTQLAGKKVFDIRSGAEITPAEALERAPSREGHRIAHLLAWLAGGSAACDLLRLRVAQERGVGKCAFFEIDSDAAFESALKWLAEHLDANAKVGLGFDVATTNKGTSNPSALAVAEEISPEITIRALLVWKTRDPEVARERLRRVVETIAARPGGPARALAVDATNERYFAEDLRKQFEALLPVELVVSSQSYEKPGLDKPTRWKEYLGEQYVALMEDNHLTLPPEAYVRADHRLVIKDRGRFVCEPDSQGRHGDTFDAAKLSVYALINGPVRIEPWMFRSGPNHPPGGIQYRMPPPLLGYNPYDPEVREMRRRVGLPTPSRSGEEPTVIYSHAHSSFRSKW